MCGRGENLSQEVLQLALFDADRIALLQDHNFPAERSHRQRRHRLGAGGLDIHRVNKPKKRFVFSLQSTLAAGHETCSAAMAPQLEPVAPRCYVQRVPLAPGFIVLLPPLCHNFTSIANPSYPAEVNC